MTQKSQPFPADGLPRVLATALNGGLDLARPVLISGPTASGKSALALAIARAGGRSIINADALQVFGGWRILTARPSRADLALAPHMLYGHVAPEAEYSVGHWLRDTAPLLDQRPAPVIVGGTGLYFSALTDGMADIPSTLAEIRAAAAARLASHGVDGLARELDPATRRRIDLRNPMRVQRAWEVQTQTGRGLAAWQDATALPLLPPENAVKLVIDADRDWLADRIAKRFDMMLEEGALAEAQAMMPRWDPTLPSSKAIGAAELIGHLRGTCSLEQARAATLQATRQYAKRQRTWFRNRMVSWLRVDAQYLTEILGS